MSDIPGVELRCKVTIKFADMQILSGKSFRNFKSYKVIGLFGEIDKSTISGAYSTFLGNESKKYVF